MSNRQQNSNILVYVFYIIFQNNINSMFRFVGIVLTVNLFLLSSQC